MTPQEPAITTAPEYRFAGWAAIISGMIGFFAYGALMTGVFSRLSGGEERFWTLLFRSHDAGAILQAAQGPELVEGQPTLVFWFAPPFVKTIALRFCARGLA